MKKVNYLEVIGILSLSLLLTSSYAVSSCLPEMLQTYVDYDRSSVDFLISSPATSMMIMIAMTPIVSRFLNERFTIITGLLLLGICGIAPVFTSSYPLVLTTRLLMGVGIGLLNAKGVSLIGERFTGSLRSRLQGFRCSMETIGQSALMLAAGQLLRFGWNYAFLIYGTAFVILLLYLAFVPARQKNADQTRNANKPQNADQTSNMEEHAASAPVTTGQKRIIATNFLMGMVLVSAAVLMSMRITSYVVETGIGTDVNGATILSISVFSGCFAGIIFGRAYEKLKRLLLPISLLMIAVGMMTIGCAGNLGMVMLGACICNFFITVSTSYMFNGLSESLPTESLHTANALVLVGCNLGSCTISFVLQAIAMIHPSVSAGFLVYGGVFVILAGACFIKYRRGLQGTHE